MIIVPKRYPHHYLCRKPPNSGTSTNVEEAKKWDVVAIAKTEVELRPNMFYQDCKDKTYFFQRTDKYTYDLMDAMKIPKISDLFSEMVNGQLVIEEIEENE